jgi:GalNAc-alpha-(1->4)-GalNAc-alpha-(1->3)-diNAcBac-PP-undecaprenol alpha-1,4-N-acetyl-D-galactosaminyltransferase
VKILFTIASLNSGGAERVLTTLANELSKKHEVIILKSDDEDPFYEINKSIVLESLCMNKINSSLIKKMMHNFSIIKVMRKSIRKHKPDVVISFMDRTNIYTVLATRFLDTKLIISERINYEYLKSKPWRVLRRMIYPFTDGMVVLSQYDFDKYSYVKDKKIIFNPLFIKNSKIDLTQKENIILSIGRLVDDKGFDVLLNALSLIDTKLLENWKILIVGDGEKKDDLERLSQNLGLGEKVKFLGKRKDVEELYKSSSIFVSTSRAEGFPNALSEALSLGCACVATDCLTGPSELIEDGKNGFLVEVDDVKEVKNRLKILLEDKKLRSDFANQGVKMSKKYGVVNIVNEWELYILKCQKKLGK